MAESRKQRRGVPQVDPKLDEPLDQDAPPTIYGSILRPDLCNAALNLAVDFAKQQQGMANRYLILHPWVIFFIVLADAIYMGPRATLPEPGSESVTEYLYKFVILNKRVLAQAGLLGVVGAAFVFTFLSRISDVYFRSITEKIVDTKGETLFGLNLNDVAMEGNDLAKSPAAENTHIVIYRQTPIALIAVSPSEVLTSPDSLVATITTMGCRRVYIKSGIIEDLLDWALVRTKALGEEHGYGPKSMKLLTEVYSFDTNIKRILSEKGFVRIQSARLRDNRLLGGIFGMRKELWGIQFHVKKNK